MAFFDDPKLLTAHLRHSFITSDDTGMCELIMINEDLDKEIKSDHKFSKRSLRLAQRYNPAEHLPRYAAQSYDIQASPTLSRRPPLKNNANMFELTEQKRKKKHSQCTVIAWHDTGNTFDPSLFPRQEILARPKIVQPSQLSTLLAEYNKLSANPFFEYSKFNGENHGFAVTNVYRIFLPMSKDPLRPITVTVLHKATVADLIGLTFWKYIEETKDPVKLRSVSHYAVKIAEDDGDIDTDLPALEREDRVAKFRFKHLGIVETRRRVVLQDSPLTQARHIVVKVNYEQGGFSTLAVDSLSVEMADILARVIRKRRLQIHGYELERQQSPGIPVDLTSSLETQGTLDFVLVKNVGRRNLNPTPAGDDSVDSPHVKAELTSHQYKSYNVIMIHKVRSNTEVLLGISGDRIEVDPVGQSRSSRIFARNSSKPSVYEIEKICACEVIDDKNPQRTVFRVVRISKDSNYKNVDFEAQVSTAKEIVRKINLILEGLPSSRAKSDYDWKEQSRSRKGSKTIV